MYFSCCYWEVWVHIVPLLKPFFCLDSFRNGTIITIATIQVVISRKRA